MLPGIPYHTAFDTKAAHSSRERAPAAHACLRADSFLFFLFLFLNFLREAAVGDVYQVPGALGLAPKGDGSEVYRTLAVLACE